MLNKGNLFFKLRRLEGVHRILLLDLGAFTTDFGLVEVDAGFHNPDWEFECRAQKSYRVAISRLDRLLLERLEPVQREAVDNSSTRQWETGKRQIYAGGEAAFLPPEGKMTIIGGKKDQERIYEVVTKFTADIVGTLDRFISSHTDGRIDELILSGGGAHIPLLRERLSVHLSELHSWHVYDLLDTYEPKRAGVTLERAVEKRKSENQKFVRGGTAVGGASVLFE